MDLALRQRLPAMWHPPGIWCESQSLIKESLVALATPTFSPTRLYKGGMQGSAS